MKMLIAVLITASIAGCSGVSIRSLSPQSAAVFHDADGKHGYVVYESLPVIQISAKVAAKPDAAAECQMTVTYLPDYNKPYVVNIKNGFGKAGADISISDGWKLTGVKDTSDNTAVLSTLMSLVPGLATKKAGDREEGCPVGIYTFQRGGTGALQLKRMAISVE